jgi:hypothetical protein
MEEWGVLLTDAFHRPLQPTAATIPLSGAAILKKGKAAVSEDRPAEGPKLIPFFSTSGSRTGAKSDRWALLPRAR